MSPRLASILFLLPLLSTLTSEASAQLKPPCTAVDQAQLEAVLSAGGTLQFGCSGSIELDETLVANGVQATVLGPAVTIRRGDLVPPIRLLEIHGGNVTFDGVNFQSGYALGVDGADGESGEDGSSGPPGMNGGEGQHGMSGDPGGDASPAEDGENGSDAGGGAILIDGGATVTLRNCLIRSNVAVGGRGGEGGYGGRGGNGGPGGYGGGGPGKNAGDGGGGGDAGSPTPGGDGGDGGTGYGGAIANAGTLTVEDCFFDNNAAQGGMAARGHFGGAGGGGGNGANGGSSYNTDPHAGSDNTGRGGYGGRGGNSSDGADGGKGGSGGSALGGAIHNTGTLAISRTTFRNNFATGVAASYGASAGPGGGAGDGGLGGLGKPGGTGGDGGNAGSGAQGGDNGNGGSGIGGAIFSTTPITLTDVTFTNNAVAAGTGGSSTCTPGDFTCFGAAGGPGLGGTKGSGGQNWLTSTYAPDGMNGVDGSSGIDGMQGAIGLGVAPDCLANDMPCAAPEPGTAALGIGALATCLALRRRARPLPGASKQSDTSDS